MSKTQYTQTQKNAMVGVMLSAIVVIGSYFLWIKSLFDALHMTIGFRIAYFIIGFFVCLGFASLLFNFNSAMANLADNKKQGAKKVKQTTITYKEYNIEHHLDGKSKSTKDLFKELQERILKLDEKIKEKVLEYYVAYGLDRNFCEIVVQANGLWVHIDMNKSEVKDPKNKLIDVSDVGHWATGNVKIKLDKLEDIDYIMSIITQSYESKL